MNAPRTGIPLRPDTHSPSVYLERACFAVAHKAVVGNNMPGSAEHFARQRWGDGVTDLILRGTALPASRSDPEWAAALARDAVSDFIASLAPISAAARLFEAAPRVSLVGINAMKFPARQGAIDPNAVLWVGEMGAGPVLQFNLASIEIGPARKLMAFAVVTREAATAGSAEIVITTLLRENAALSLDASLFSNTAATTVRPAGILNGVPPLTAAAAGSEAMDSDLAALAGAIANVTTGLAYVAHPKQANAIKIRRGSKWSANVPVWPSIGVPTGTVIACDPAAFVSAFGSEPEIEASADAVLHMEAATPAENVAGASPVQNLFQTDCVATKLRLRCAWAWRMTGAVAWLQNANW
jgi:hypothetical protein